MILAGALAAIIPQKNAAMADKTAAITRGLDGRAADRVARLEGFRLGAAALAA